MIAHRSCWPAIFLLLFSSFAGVAPAQTSPEDEYGEILDFFAIEAQVITAARQPHSQRRAPATIYVVTREEIQASGAQTLWDALRAVPGVDVLAVHAAQGEVSIRGLDKSLNNRTLVLLDGKPVMDRYYDRVSWESIPISLEELDRIEVVEGPASALYGANAINGVINLITRTPEQLAGGAVRLTVEAGDTYLGSALYGVRQGPLAGKVSVERRESSRSENPDSLAFEVNRFHAYLSYRPAATVQLSVRGGMTDRALPLNPAAFGVMQESGTNGYLRVDLQRENSRLQAYWDRHRTHLLGPNALPDNPGLPNDTYHLLAERVMRLADHHTLTAGSSWSISQMRSPLLASGTHTRHLHSLYFENQWRRRELELVTSARLDRHSLAGWMFSPRGSAVFSPAPRHVLRLSAGSSFRFPTLAENEFQVQRISVINSSFIDTLAIFFMGSRKLDPERLQMLELAYAFQLPRLQLTAVGFRYWLKDVIASTEPEFDMALPIPQIRVSFENRVGQIRAWGGELEGRARLTARWSVFLNYAFQNLDDVLDPLAATNGGPRHKINAGSRFTAGGLAAGLQLHWVDTTYWYRNALLTPISRPGRMKSYFLLNGRIAYSLRGRLRGLTLGTEFSSLLDRVHYEILPSTDDLNPGQQGQPIRRRVTCTVSYQF